MWGKLSVTLPPARVPAVKKKHQKSTERNHAFGPSVGVGSKPLPPLFLLVNTESMAVFLTSLLVFLLSVLERKLISKGTGKLG